MALRKFVRSTCRSEHDLRLPGTFTTSYYPAAPAHFLSTDPAVAIVRSCLSKSHYSASVPLQTAQTRNSRRRNRPVFCFATVHLARRVCAPSARSRVVSNGRRNRAFLSSITWNFVGSLKRSRAKLARNAESRFVRIERERFRRGPKTSGAGGMGARARARSGPKKIYT